MPGTDTVDGATSSSGLSPYARATQCPVLTPRMWYARLQREISNFEKISKNADPEAPEHGFDLVEFMKSQQNLQKGELSRAGSSRRSWY
eukprot:1659091-Rhodomonas_salina.3